MAFAHYEAHAPVEVSAHEAARNRNTTLLLLLLLVGVLFAWYRYNGMKLEQASPGDTTVVATPAIVDEKYEPAAARDTPSMARVARTTVEQAPLRSSNAEPIAGNPLPEYPISALRHAEGGQVVLQVRIDEKGQPIDVDVARRSGSRDLDRAAMQAVREWRFKPAIRDGKPVASVVELPVAFKPEG